MNIVNRESEANFPDDLSKCFMYKLRSKILIFYNLFSLKLKWSEFKEFPQLLLKLFQFPKCFKDKFEIWNFHNFIAMTHQKFLLSNNHFTTYAIIFLPSTLFNPLLIMISLLFFRELLRSKSPESNFFDIQWDS